MKVHRIGKYIVADPEVCFGKPTFKGTRLPVQTVLNWLSKGKTIDAVLADWPYLKKDAVTEAVRLAGKLLTKHFAIDSAP